MADYLIEQYNAKLDLAQQQLADTTACATTAWRSVLEQAVARWQEESAAAGIELKTQMEARNRHYVEGPSIEEPYAAPSEENVEKILADRIQRQHARQITSADAESPRDAKILKGVFNSSGEILKLTDEIKPGGITFVEKLPNNFTQSDDYRRPAEDP